MTIGILGGGQLARMLALDGIRLGLDFVFLEPNPGPVRQLGRCIQTAYDDPEGLLELRRSCDRVTYEFENIPSEVLGEMPGLWPNRRSLEVSQDRLFEKELFEKLGIPTVNFRCEGYPALLKTRRGGYDGKNQWRLTQAPDPEVGPSIREELVNFDRELSLIGVRSTTGEVAFYPLVENRHESGILRESTCPAKNAPQEFAESAMRKLMEHLDYVGVMAIEWFDVQGRLLANEWAPRVHNSGHWTLEGAVTSQFENHLRAGLGLPLGSTALTGQSRMWNLIGDVPELPELLADPRKRVHLYGKSGRPGRKVGHVTEVDYVQR